MEVFESITAAQWILIALSAAGVVVLYFRVDDRKEVRRKDAIKAAGQLAAVGDEDFAEVLQCYAVGDYTGVAASIRELVQKISQPGGALEYRAGIVVRMLPHLLEHPVYGPKIANAVGKSVPPHTAPPTDPFG